MGLKRDMVSVSHEQYICPSNNNHSIVNKKRSAVDRENGWQTIAEFSPNATT